jgi:hypothetical protein
MLQGDGIGMGAEVAPLLERKVRLASFSGAADRLHDVRATDPYRTP